MKEYAEIRGEAIFAWPLSLSDITLAHPRVSLPVPPSPDDLALLGYAIVDREAAPVAAPGEFIVYGAPVRIGPGLWRRPASLEPATADQLIAYENELHSAIDRECGIFRMRFITDVPGQSSTYDAKVKEVAEYAENPAGTFLFLEAEAAATDRTVAEVAAEVGAIANAWRVLGAAIEGRRIAAKRAVSQARVAGSWAGMEAAASVEWDALLA